MPETLSWLDHLLVAVLLVGLPLGAVHSRRSVEREIAAGRPIERRRLYANTMLAQWSLALVAVITWIVAERSWRTLGLGLALHWRFWVAAALTACAVGVLVQQLVRAHRDPGFAARVAASAKSVEFLLPVNEAEYRAFSALGLTAGLVEELLCRGYLVWYLDAFMPLGLAGVAAAAAFGIAHAYQGAKNVALTGGAGLVMAGLYFLSGSLWLPMLLHAATDLLQVRMLLVSRRPRVADAGSLLTAAARS